ncbi:MAG: SGNH/GDSL hydrolase family protein [Candidatus Marinimicrobia bacterium]|jgi:lysophospholipase L1-like esterase|nr:SGNH/GDSL hydrolase family protein [Candidatus Neomarinimicrobiota bacterium]MBT3823699.1 SGNH/GDSL hydrolase family protein [Candidatus Neomarinimicrobiota bacterium]MBT4294678.1 SGNH/GDSL hydrolase family protein [Candidatus Neomarinimicrobiota bacterium]MBT4994438.1 SGNH/GDSL hydrolase family protein [Candidatus Neomarinimicrobiota bacterium]MBT7201358.1 SGNH/GDSL hydrolase family protein [Candidatus Neomarinimicrobiota bacterium]
MISNIVFFGDSITAANRSPKVPLGVGYVSILKDLFSANTDLKDVQFVNSGVSGHTVGDLLGRFNTDVLDHHPDAVAIMIGINDAYNDFFVDSDSGQVQNYEIGLDKLINDLQAGLPQAQFFLFTPYLISDSSTEAFYLKMEEYCEVVKKLGIKHAIPVLDIQSVFNSAVETKPAKEWADDQIHPFHEGHTLIARAAYTFLQDHISEN